MIEHWVKISFERSSKSINKFSKRLIILNIKINILSLYVTQAFALKKLNKFIEDDSLLFISSVLSYVFKFDENKLLLISVLKSHKEFVD